MNRGGERTILIAAETPEVGSAGAEGGSCPAEVRIDVVEEAVLSIGAVHDVDVKDGEVFVQDVEETPWEVEVDGDLCPGPSAGGDNTQIITLHDWTALAEADVLDVRCKTVAGQLHKSRLGSGGRGRCIQRLGKWLTPREFEALSGRAQSKDWKRSIRFGGRSLQSVIDAGLLQPHATNCACAICSEDPSVSEPVRLFTPYRKRKFRSSSPKDGPQQKQPRAEPSSDGCAESDRPPSDSDQLELVAEISSLPPEAMWDSLEEMSRTLLRQALTLKQVIRTCREQSRSVAASSAVAARNGARGTASLPTPTPVQSANISIRCSNCRRPPTLECGSCHGVTYCSAFCCRKDWGDHSRDCRPAQVIIRSPHPTVTTVPAPVPAPVRPDPVPVPVTAVHVPAQNPDPTAAGSVVTPAPAENGSDANVVYCCLLPHSSS